MSKYNKEYYEKNKEKILEYRKEYSKEYYEQNKEKLKSYNKDYRENNPEKTKKYNDSLKSKYKTDENHKTKIKQRAKEYFSLNPQKRLHYSARTRAKERELDFSISPEDIQIPSHCPILGVELITTTGHGGKLRYGISIDRIDSSKGYIKDNIWVISNLANTMKQDATKEELLMFARGILKMYGET